MKALYILPVFLLFNFLLSAQQPLTVREVFDFNIGDEFHYVTTDQHTKRGERKKVIDKYYSTGLDTLYYTFHVNEYYTYPAHGGGRATDFSIDTVIDSYTSLDSVVYHFLRGQIIEADTTAMKITLYANTKCDSLTIGYEKIYDTMALETTVRIREYGKGLGITHEAYIPGGSPELESAMHLVYVKKGNNECGKADLTSIPELSAMTAVSIFPQPLTEHSLLVLDHSSGEEFTSIILYDITGQSIGEYRQLNTTSFPIGRMIKKSGVYIYEITTEKGKSITGKLIK